MMYCANDIYIYIFPFVTGEYEIIPASLSLLRPVSMVMCAARVCIEALFVCCYKVVLLFRLTAPRNKGKFYHEPAEHKYNTNL